MPLEGRGLHMIARREETPSVLGSGEPVATKLVVKELGIIPG